MPETWVGNLLRQSVSFNWLHCKVCQCNKPEIFATLQNLRPHIFLKWFFFISFWCLWAAGQVCWDSECTPPNKIKFIFLLKYMISHWHSQICNHPYELTFKNHTLPSIQNICHTDRMRCTELKRALREMPGTWVGNLWDRVSVLSDCVAKCARATYLRSIYHFTKLKTTHFSQMIFFYQLLMSLSCRTSLLCFRVHTTKQNQIHFSLETHDKPFVHS